MAASPRFHALLKQMAELHDAKNADYAGEAATDDPFANFRLCEGMGISALQGCIVRMGDKFARIQSLMKKGDANRKVKDESLRDTLLDNAVYSMIAVCLLDEENAVYADRDPKSGAWIPRKLSTSVRPDEEGESGPPDVLITCTCGETIRLPQVEGATVVCRYRSVRYQFVAGNVQFYMPSTGRAKVVDDYRLADAKA
jgi:hypothetical protein